MARIAAGFGSSHSIMLVSRREDWQHGFREVDRRNQHYFDRDGAKTTYDALLAVAPPDAESRVAPDRMGERWDAAEAAMDALRDRIAAARLDALVIVGDDQTELFDTRNNPAFAIYYGETIRNAKRPDEPAPNWYVAARFARQEPDADRHYPVRADLARWLVRDLCDRDFDVAAMDGLTPQQFEGHAFSFVHKRLIADPTLPVVPVIVNTFDPPNQPTPRRCTQLGAALRAAIEAFPQDLRVGVLASGGLSHFVVDEDLDRGVIDAIRRRDRAWLAALDPKRLQAGSSEIRNWIIAATALEALELDWVEYVPGYRSPALTGTGLCFAAWTPKETH